MCTRTDASRFTAHDEYVTDSFHDAAPLDAVEADAPAFEPFSLEMLTPSAPDVEETPSHTPAHAYVSDEPVHPFATEEPAPAPASSVMGFGAADDEAVDADEVARQLASLSPRAARAVAAAAKADTMEEREAALADVTGDDDEPVNRGLLLKFLSSVRS